MNFTISRDKLISALEIVCRIAGKAKALPILQNVHIKVKNGRVRFEATSIEVSARRYTDLVSYDGEGEMLVDALTLSRYIKLTRSENITFETNDAELRIRHNDGVLDMPLVDGKAWPQSQFDMVKDGTTVLLPATVVEDVAMDTPSFLSNDDFHPTMKCTHIGCRPDHISIDATDSLKLMRITVEADCPMTCDILVPQDVLPMLQPDTTLVEVTATDTLLSWNFGDTAICHSVIKGNYPDFNRVIPKNNHIQARINKGALILAARRIGSITSGTSTMKMAFGYDHCDISVRDLDTMKLVQEKLTCRCQMPITIGVSAPFLVDCLNAIPDEDVVMTFSEPERPMMFVSESMPNKTVMLMPMKVDE